MMRVALVALLTACVPDDPHEGDTALQIEVLPAQEVQLADGLGHADIVVTWDEATGVFRREVTVTVSSGTVGAGGGEDARTFVGRAEAGGMLVVPVAYGREPGPLRVEARTAGFALVDDSLLLAPRAPDRIALSLASGEISSGSAVTLSIALAVDGGGAPSYGVRVALRGCCAAGGKPAVCGAGLPVPVQVASFVAQTPGEEGLSTEVTASPGVGGNDEGEATLAFVVAGIGATPPPCAAPDGPGVAAVALSVR